MSAGSDCHPGSRAVRHFRFVVVILILWTLSTLAVRRYVGVGWFWPIRVASNSMVPALLGPHAEQSCPNCRELIVVDASEGIPPAATCFNCGTRQEPFRGATWQPGSRVVLDRWTARKAGPQRFEIVAFIEPGPDRRWLTKRVVGLPDETVEIVDGDILVNATCARKSASQFLNSALLVHAYRAVNRCADTSRLVPRWEHTGWEVTEGVWRWRPTSPWDRQAPGEELDWLDYRHRSSPTVVGNPKSRQQILDEYSYDPTESRPLHVVRDIACTVTASLKGRGPLAVELSTPAGRARLSLTDGQVPAVTLDGQAMGAKSMTVLKVDLQDRVRILFGYWDRQLIVRLGDLQEVSLVIDAGDLSPESILDAPQVSLAAGESGEMHLTELLVWRDVYYFADPDRGMASRFKLGPDQYALLGDNTWSSDDARISEDRGIVDREQILGIVTKIK